MSVRSRLVLVLGVAAAAVAAPPAAPQAGACDPGAFTTAAPMGDLGVSAESPAQPQILSAVRVKPRSRIGCQCDDPCIEEVLVEFRVNEEAPWARIDAGGRTHYSARASGSDPGESLFYYKPGSIGGPVPGVFDISVLDSSGHRSMPATASVPPNSDAETR